MFAAPGWFHTPLMVEEAAKRDLLVAPHTGKSLNRGSPLAPAGTYGR